MSNERRNIEGGNIEDLTNADSTYVCEAKDETVVGVRGKIDMNLLKDALHTVMLDIEGIDSSSNVLHNLPLEKVVEIIDQITMAEIGALLAENTLQSHKEVKRLLHKNQFLSIQQYDEIWEKGEHAFMKRDIDLHSPLAELVVEYGNLGPNSLSYEMGSGPGIDAIYIARKTNTSIFGVDGSKNANDAAQKNIEQAQIEHGELQIVLAEEDYMKQLEYMPIQFDVIMSNSSLHYDPPKVVQEEKFPLIASKMTDDGIFFLGMKLASSDSAKQEKHIRLMEDDAYNSSLDRVDGIYRFYPENIEDVVALAEPTFNIIHSEVRILTGYEKVGIDEAFALLVCKKKKKPGEIQIDKA